MGEKGVKATSFTLFVRSETTDGEIHIIILFRQIDLLVCMGKIV